MTQAQVIKLIHDRNCSPELQDWYRRMVAAHTMLVPCARDSTGRMVQFGDELRFSPKYDTVMTVPTSLYELSVDDDPEYVRLTSLKYLRSHLISHAELRFRAG